MTAECNLYVIYSALLGDRYLKGSKTVNFSENIMKIMAVLKNREFLFINVFTSRHCCLYPLGPTQFSIYLSISIEWVATIGGIVTFVTFRDLLASSNF